MSSKKEENLENKNRFWLKNIRWMLLHSVQRLKIKNYSARNLWMNIMHNSVIVKGEKNGNSNRFGSILLIRRQKTLAAFLESIFGDILKEKWKL